MCRMIAAVGGVSPDQLIAAASLMSNGATACHEYARTTPSGAAGGMRHYDGWGMIYRNPSGNLVCFRSEAAIGSYREVRHLPRTQLMAVHVRNASLPTQKGMAYVHPIEGRVRGKAAFFFHNGYVPGLGRPSGSASADWDSRNLFEWLESAFEADDRVSEIHRRMNELPRDTTAANFLLVEADKITVCNWFADDVAAPRYYTMYTCSQAGVVIVASEIIPMVAPAISWAPLGNRNVLEVSASGLENGSGPHE